MSDTKPCTSCNKIATKKNCCGRCKTTIVAICVGCTKSCKQCKRAYFCSCDKKRECNSCRGDLIYITNSFESSKTLHLMSAPAHLPLWNPYDY